MHIHRLPALCAGVLLLGAVASGSASTPLGEVASVAAGTHHTCVVTTAGGVSCWGLNATSELGLGAAAGAALRPTAVPLPGVSGIRALATGYAHSCAIDAVRAVQCWGLNSSGQSGDASLSYARPSPGPVEGLPAPAIALATGQAHSCALLEGGEVRCWGDNALGQLGDGQGPAPRADAAAVALAGPARTIAAGSAHSCAALVDGRVFCWGLNNQGQLGDGSTADRARPVAVQGLNAPVTSLALASGSSCALDAAGGVACWGPQYPLAAFSGGSLQARPYPGLESGIASLVAGSNHFCALTLAGATRCFGDNAYGQFGTGPIDGSLAVESTVDLAPDVTQLAAGGSHTCARNARGGLQCWGDDSFGQLGIGSTSLRLVPTPVAGLESGVAMVGSGGYHGCALTSAGAVKCWGTNPAVGDGSTRLRLTPVDVPGLSSGVLSLETGVRSNCVITAQRRAQCWGLNYAGQLGIGQPVDSALPTPVVGLGDVDVLALGIGRDHACALLAGGAVKCWGSNEYGQVGDGSDQTRLGAVAVAGLDAGVRAISVGCVHTCATTGGGALLCWGDVGGGNALGDGGSGGRRVPGPVPALQAGVVSISASLFDTCVLLEQGALQCWGSNDGGNLGDNSTISRPTPIPVPGMARGVSHVDGSYGNGGHTCAVVGGAAKCWGENIFAQVGDGTTHGVPTAQTVLADEASRRVGVVDADANAASSAAQVDASGRYVVFQSEADNLVPGDSNGASDIFRLDRQSGEVIRVSLDTDGAQLAGASREPSVSADGRVVVFVAPDAAAGKLAGESAKQRAARRKSSHFAVLLRNLVTGTTQRLGSALALGGQPRIAPNAGAVAFVAAPASAAEGPVGQPNVYVASLTRSGAALLPAAPRCVSCKSTTVLGAATAADANAPSGSPALSADGQWLVYQSGASNALADVPAPCPAGNFQVLLRNLVTGASQRISPTPALSAGACGALGSQRPSIDYAGQTIAWQSDQALVPGDDNGVDDAYVWRAAQPAPLRVSVGSDGVDTVGAAQAPQVSGDGRHVVFVSAASNHDLATPDNNERVDLHGVSLEDPTDIRRLSRTADGGEANAAAQAPSVNYDGSQLAFHSAASNLASGAGGRSAVFARVNPLAPARKSATWWVPTESGWGLTVFDQGNLLAPTWFTYDRDGEPTWFIVGGAFPQADGTYRGDALRLTGVPFDRIEGNATLGAQTVGSVTLDYRAEDRLGFAYRVDGIEQAKTLDRFPFGARDFVCSGSPSPDRSGADNYTDLWTGAGGGWGLTLFHVDELLVAIWYTYDLDGEAVFFVVSTTRLADGSFGGQVFRQRDGTPFSAIDGQRASPGADPVGTASFRFTTGQTASFSYVVNGIAQTRAIDRLLVGNQAQTCRATDAD